MIKIAIVDDHQILLDGLSFFFRDEPDIEIVATATKGNLILEELTTHQPDILITDIEMPEMDGIEVTQKAKEVLPDIKVLALTMYNEQAYIKDMLRAGANGYILKNSSKEEFLKAIHAVLTDGSYLSPEVMKNFMGSHQQKESVYGRKLSDREIEIIQLIAEELTTDQIANKLHLSALTVKTHRKNILLKLGLKNSAGLVKYAMRKGLIE